MSVPRTTRDSQDPTRVVCQVTAGRLDREREQGRCEQSISIVRPANESQGDIVGCWSVVRGATMFGRVAREHVLAREDRSFERTLFPALVPFGIGWVGL